MLKWLLDLMGRGRRKTIQPERIDRSDHIDPDAPTILPEGGIFGAGLTQDEFWAGADRQVGDIKWILLEKDGKEPEGFRDDESFIEAFMAPIADPINPRAPDDIRQDGVGHDDHPDSDSGKKENIMLDDSVITRRGRCSAPFKEKPKERTMRNWGTFGLIAAVLTLAASPFLIQFGNDYFDGKQQLAPMPASVPTTKETAASPLLPSIKVGKRVEAEVETPKPTQVVLYTVVKGDTLSGMCGSGWKKVAEANELVAPYTIRAGQSLIVPEGAQCKVAPRAASKTATVEIGYRTIDCSKTSKGFCEWKHVGGNKFRGKGDSFYALTRQFGLTADEAMEALAGIEDGEEVLIATGQSLYRLSFGKNDLWEGKTILRAASQKAMKYVTKSGKTIYRFEVCGNWAQLSQNDQNPRLETVEVPEPVTPATVEVVPQPAPVVVAEGPKEPEAAPEPEVVVEPKEPSEEVARPSCFEWDWFLGTGGDDTGTRYSHTEAAVYPFCKDGENGKHYFGLGLKGSIADGTTDTGFGWDGREKLYGLAHKYVSHDGWDISSKLLWGELEENGKIDLYKSQRRFDLVGVSLAYNNYERYLRGEKWYPEWNAYLGIFFPTSSDVKHSWDGKPIADTKDLERFDYKLGVGARQYLYAGEDIWPFVSGGLSIQHPTSKSGNLRIGVADANKIFFASVGINHNFDDGENAFGWDLGVDMARGIKLARAEARRADMLQKLEEDGVMVDGESGIAFVATDSSPKPKSAKPVRKPAKESVWESPWDFER